MWKNLNDLKKGVSTACLAEKSKPTAGTEIKKREAYEEETQMRFFSKGRKRDSKQELWIERLDIDTGNWFQCRTAHYS